MLDNNKLFETTLCINDGEHGEIISLNLQFISKPVLTANGNIDYKNITHNYTTPGYGNYLVNNNSNLNIFSYKK